MERWKPFPTKLPKTGSEARDQEDQRNADVPGGKGKVKQKQKLVQKNK